MDRGFTWASSPRSTIRCVQNDFSTDGIFGANCAPILHRQWHCLQIETSEIPHDLRRLGVPSDASKMIFEPMVHSTQTVHISFVKISTISERTKTRFHLSLITKWYHQVRRKMISKPMVRLAQTMNLSCTYASTVSERKEARFHMTHVT
jgi:hypothetical protein